MSGRTSLVHTLAAGWPPKVDICLPLLKKSHGNLISGAHGWLLKWWALESEIGLGGGAATVQASASTSNCIPGCLGGHTGMGGTGGSRDIPLPRDREELAGHRFDSGGRRSRGRQKEVWETSLNTSLGRGAGETC